MGHHGRGIAFARRSVLGRGRFYGGEVIRISPTGPLLYYPSRRHMPAPLRAFVDFVKAGRSAGNW